MGETNSAFLPSPQAVGRRSPPRADSMPTSLLFARLIRCRICVRPPSALRSPSLGQSGSMTCTTSTISSRNGPPSGSATVASQYGSSPELQQRLWHNRLHPNHRCHRGRRSTLRCLAHSLIGNGDGDLEPAQLIVSRHRRKLAPPLDSCHYHLNLTGPRSLGGALRIRELLGC